jgi:hypothetical protein
LPATHVEAHVDSFEDRGSTPLASIISPFSPGIFGVGLPR